MAIEAFVYRGYPRERGASDVGMAKFTLDPFYPRMNAMAEWYGLFRADVRCRWSVEVVEKYKDQDEDASDEQKEPSVFRKKVLEGGTVFHQLSPSPQQRERIPENVLRRR